MKICLPTKLFILFTIFLLYGCKIEINQESKDYNHQIISWFAQDYDKLQDSGGEWFLYFDDQITCNTCKLDILSRVRADSMLWIITRFDSNEKQEAFRRAYKLENPMINLKVDHKHILQIPFIFQLDENSLRNPIVLDDEELAKDVWHQSFRNLP